MKVRGVEVKCACQCGWG